MNNTEQEKNETNVSSENSEATTTKEEQPNPVEEQRNTEESGATSNEPVKARRPVISQDIRYATEPDEQDKLLEKYQQYQVSESNACHLRFLTDHRQNKTLLGRNDGKILFRPVKKMPMISVRYQMNIPICRNWPKLSMWCFK